MQNVGLYSALIAFERRGRSFVLQSLRHGSSAVAASKKCQTSVLIIFKSTGSCFVYFQECIVSETIGDDFIYHYNLGCVDKSVQYL